MSLSVLLHKLKLTENKGLYWTAEKKWKELDLPYRIQKNLELINPTAFFCIDGEPYILFFENLGQEHERSVHRQVWNFNQSPLAFIIDDTKISVFNAFSLHKDKKYGLQILDTFDINDSSAKSDKYSLWNLISGKYWEDNKTKFKSDRRVDWYLLKNIEEAISLLEEKKITREIANKIIGFLIFTRYLVDRKVTLDGKYINNQSVEHARKSLLTVIRTPAKLIEFYHHVKDAFNGDLFELSAGELNEIDSKHCEILHLLFQGGAVVKKQKSLFDIYDFEIIPVELISNIYERFIGKNKQSETKAFYTPPFLVDYILEKTVNKHLKESDSSRCRVLDPACGSGIFLVETFRQIVEKEKQLKGDKLSAEELERLLIDNIYGIDLDEKAIDIAIFSLYITILDYKEPREIVDYKFPRLKYHEDSHDSARGQNFFQADFLEWENPVFDFIKSKQFDFIIGNPPWGSIKTEENLAFIDKCKNEGVIISDYQIAQSFLIRAKDFSIEGITKIALIVSSKIFYNDKAAAFREYILHNYKLDEIFNLSPVRRLIFKKAIGPAAIVFCEIGKDINNEFKHISLLPNLYLKMFKKPVIEKRGVKRLKQSLLSEMDWLWKPVLYGDSLDFYFLKRLMESFISFEDYLSNNKLTMGAGLKKAKRSKKREHIADLDYLPPGIVIPFVSDYQLKKVKDEFKDLLLENDGITSVYHGPHLIIKRGINRRPALTFRQETCAFPNSLFGVASESKDVTLLKSLGALLNSDLIIYFLFLTSGEWGVYMDEIHKDDYFKIRLPELNNPQETHLSLLFESVQANFNKSIVQRGLFGQIGVDERQSKRIKDDIMKNFEMLGGEELKNTNDFVNEIYSVSETEKDLIDYAIHISIPLFKDDPAPLRSPDAEQLRKYADIFTDYFKDWYNGPDDYFQVEIYRTRFFTCMNFKIIPNPPEVPIEEPVDCKITQIIEILGKSISIEMITNDLFIQKDIKGFEEESFYVIKPNEYKCWHPAIARSDLLEFIDAILKNDAATKHE